MPICRDRYKRFAGKERGREEFLMACHPGFLFTFK